MGVSTHKPFNLFLCWWGFLALGCLEVHLPNLLVHFEVSELGTELFLVNGTN